MANNHSVEFLRGAVAALERKPYSAYTTSVLLAEYQSLLAAAEAREKAALGTDWDDPDVQFVYRLLCSNELPGSPEEHWEGKVARMAVAHLRSRAAEAREAGKPNAAEVIEELHGCFDTIKHLSADIGTDSGDIAVNGVALLGLAKIARWKEANGGK